MFIHYSITQYSLLANTFSFFLQELSDFFGSLDFLECLRIDLLLL